MRRSKSFTLRLAAVMVATAMLAATAQAGPRATKDTLVMAVQEIGTTLDARTYQANHVTILQATQEPLLFYKQRLLKNRTIPTFDPTGYEPGLATSWKLATDGKSITLNLRKGVKSFFGNEFTSADVEWTVGRNNFYKSLGAGFAYGQAGIDPANPLTVIDKYTVRFNLVNPSPNLEKILNFHWISPIDSTEAKTHATSTDPWAQGWFATNTAGFGPYSVTSYQPGVSATLEANPNYYGTKPTIKRIVMRVIPDPGQRQQLLESGAVQLVPDLPRVQLVKLQENKKVKVEFARSTRMLYLLMNNNFKPFDNVWVRQAIANALPVDDIIKTAYQGTATKALGPVSPQLQYHRSDLWKYLKPDLAKARELLAKGGYPNGFDIDLQYSLSNPGPENAQVAVTVQNALKAIGINVTLKQATSDADYFAQMLAKKIPFGLGGTAPFVADPGYQLFNTGLPTGPSAFAAFNHQPFTDAVTASTKTVDPKVRKNLIWTAQTMWNFFVPMFPIVEPNYGIASAPNVTGWSVQSTGFPLLGRVTYTS